MAATLDAISTLAEVLTQHGPLHKDEITQHARDRGMDDPDSALQWNVLEMDCPARQLVDDRWVGLPAVLAGRVFTHRLGADESAHDVLTVTPDLSLITAAALRPRSGVVDCGCVGAELTTRRRWLPPRTRAPRPK